MYVGTFHTVLTKHQIRMHLEFQTPDHRLPISYVQPQADQFHFRHQQLKYQVFTFLLVCINTNLLISYVYL